MISVLSQHDFLSRKHSGSPNETITDKYGSLFTKYSCFSEVDPPVPRPVQVREKPSRRHSGVRRKPQPIVSPPPFLTPQKDKDPLRVMVGLLNVINTDNYSKVFVKLRFLIDSSNLPKIIATILEKCCIATIFVNVYIKLIEDIGTLYNIKPITELWANQATSKIIPPSVSSGDVYDDFCLMQKHKMYVTGLNTTLIKLAKASLISMDSIQAYTHHVCLVLCEGVKDEHTLDRLINILVEIRKAFKGIVPPSKIEAICQLHQDVPHRIRFLLQEFQAIPN